MYLTITIIIVDLDNSLYQHYLRCHPQRKM